MVKNTQTDIRWAQCIMTQCKEKYRGWIDYISRWGCLVTSLANILDKTPKELNDIIIENKCYEYLYDKKTVENRASFLMLDRLRFIIDTNIVNELSYNNYYEANKTYWIARIIHRSGGGHYVNVLRKDKGFWYIFDVENGKEKRLQTKDITKLIKVEIQ